ncbi:MAG: OadG family transporter subunit [Eubacteriales bacterium]
MTDITVPESVLYALFCMAVVFAVLVVLFLAIKLFSYALGAFGHLGKSAGRLSPVSFPPPAATATTPTATPPAPVTNRLRLYDVDEPTAALLMAIVSDEAGIPLEQLRFVSIRALSETT